jgi:hypothetical protein
MRSRPWERMFSWPSDNEIAATSRLTRSAKVFAFIEAENANFPIVFMCSRLGVFRAVDRRRRAHRDDLQDPRRESRRHHVRLVPVESMDRLVERIGRAPSVATGISTRRVLIDERLGEVVENLG